MRGHLSLLIKCFVFSCSIADIVVTGGGGGGGGGGVDDWLKLAETYLMEIY